VVDSGEVGRSAVYSKYTNGNRSADTRVNQI
jgi:hypothetical protein